MIITEKQIFQLIKVAEDYVHKIGIMISAGMVSGDPGWLMKNINNLLKDITEQQSEEPKEIK